MWGHIRLISAGIGWTVKVFKLAKRLQKRYKASKPVVVHAAMIAFDDLDKDEQDSYIRRAKKERGVKNGNNR